MVKRNEETITIATPPEQPPFPSKKDNNPKGVIDLPDYSSDPSEKYDKRFCFTSLVSSGDSPLEDDVNVINANGVANSRGQGKNNQYNFNKGVSGQWNKNRDWDGGNLTGM